MKNVEIINAYLRQTQKWDCGGVAIFTCAEKNFFEVHKLPIPIGNMFVVDSSPYIRPLAELFEDWETYCLVVLDHMHAKIFFVSLAEISDSKSVSKDIFRKHKKGGMSQMRFQRIRHERISHFYKHVSDMLTKIVSDEKIVLAGPKDAKREFMKYLPLNIRERVIGMIDLDIRQSDKELVMKSYEIFTAEEHAEETKLVDELCTEILRDGLIVYGTKNVLQAVTEGRADRILINKDLKVRGWKCEHCKLIDEGFRDICSNCDKKTVEVDVIEEIVELAMLTNTKVDFVVPNKDLKNFGGIGAFLSFK
jgi:peptide chain release factor subunit 1